MVLYLEEVCFYLSKSDYFSNTVNFPFILTGIDSLLPNRFFSFFLVISSRIPVRFIDKCAIAATIALSIRKTDKMTLTGARVIISHMVYQIIHIPIATIETPDITEIFIFSDFVNSRTTFGSGTFGYEWFSSLGVGLTLIGKSWKTHPEIFLKFSFSGPSHRPFYWKTHPFEFFD